MREKLYVGPKLRLLREQQGLTLDACAARLGLSPSYLSQLETNQRPVTARVLIALSRTFAVDPAAFDADDESRLIADLREASADLVDAGSDPATSGLDAEAADAGSSAATAPAGQGAGLCPQAQSCLARCPGACSLWARR